jgi:hypothetical protein
VDIPAQSIPRSKGFGKSDETREWVSEWVNEWMSEWVNQQEGEREREIHILYIIHLFTQSIKNI